MITRQKRNNILEQAQPLFLKTLSQTRLHNSLSYEDTQEAAQDLRLYMIELLDAYDEEGIVTPFAYLAASLHYFPGNYAKKYNVIPIPVDMSEYQNEVEDKEGDPEAIFIAREYIDQNKTLNDKDKRLLRRIYVEGYTLKEVAQSEKTTIGKLHYRLEKIKKSIRNL